MARSSLIHTTHQRTSSANNTLTHPANLRQIVAKNGHVLSESDDAPAKRAAPAEGGTMSPDAARAAAGGLGSIKGADQAGGQAAAAAPASAASAGAQAHAGRGSVDVAWDAVDAGVAAPSQSLFFLFTLRFRFLFSFLVLSFSRAFWMQGWLRLPRLQSRVR